MSRLIGCAAVVIALFGCDGATRYPVSGVVTLDGKPVNVGMIEFMPVETGPSARGQITAGGEYQLTTFDEGDGALPGEYVVLVSQPQLLGALREAPEEHQATHEHGENQLGIVPRLYGRPATTDLRATVTTEPNRHDFDLVRPEPAAK